MMAVVIEQPSSHRIADRLRGPLGAYLWALGVSLWFVPIVVPSLYDLHNLGDGTLPGWVWPLAASVAWGWVLGLLDARALRSWSSVAAPLAVMLWPAVFIFGLWENADRFEDVDYTPALILAAVVIIVNLAAIAVAFSAGWRLGAPARRRAGRLGAGRP